VVEVEGSVIIVAKDEATKWAMWKFLHDHGVTLHQSADFQAIGRMSDVTHEPMGVVAYNGFCGRVCSMHIAGEGNWISREFIRAAFDYPFRQLELEAVLSPLAATNHRAMKLDTHFGFREVHRVENGWEPGIDLVILQLRRSDCRYLEKDHGRKILDAASA
jgi:RimJ/RimL family protein N-acetyltransferase